MSGKRRSTRDELAVLTEEASNKQESTPSSSSLSAAETVEYALSEWLSRPPPSPEERRRQARPPFRPGFQYSAQLGADHARGIDAELRGLLNNAPIAFKAEVLASGRRVRIGDSEYIVGPMSLSKEKLEALRTSVAKALAAFKPHGSLPTVEQHQKSRRLLYAQLGRFESAPSTIAMPGNSGPIPASKDSPSPKAPMSKETSPQADPAIRGSSLKSQQAPQGSSAPAPRVRLSFEVSAQINRILELLAASMDTTKSEVFKRALALLKVAKDAEAKGQVLALVDEKTNAIVTTIVGL